MANQFLALSLFIVLLSFFIVLNSISTFEISKTRPVLESLGLAFRTEKTDPLFGLKDMAVIPGEQDFARSMTGQGSALQKIEALFSSHIEGLEVRRNRLGNEMAVRLPFAEFSKQIHEELAPGKKEDDERFLPVLVSLMEAGEAQGAPSYRMDMVLETAENPYSPSLFSGAGAGASLAAIALRLETAGLPANLLGAGLLKGENGMLTLRFRRDEPSDRTGPGEEKP